MSFFSKWDLKKKRNPEQEYTCIPEEAYYSGSGNHRWHEIPIGIGSQGEIVWDIFKTPHMWTGGKEDSSRASTLDSIMCHALQYPDWLVFGIDIGGTHLTNYSSHKETVIDISTNYEDALETLRLVHKVMKHRLTLLENERKNLFVDLRVEYDSKSFNLDFRSQALDFEDLYNPASKSIILVINEDSPQENFQKGKKEPPSESSRLAHDILLRGKTAGIYVALSSGWEEAFICGSNFYYPNLFNAKIVYGRTSFDESVKVFSSPSSALLPNIPGRGIAEIPWHLKRLYCFQTYSHHDDWLKSRLRKSDSTNI